ncbi:MAG: hypothetical protein HYY62_05925 [Deltaproteobacteria bacterium]|nr:hypothetical protein [Deltaproteobacteria bacterium]
MRGNLLFILIFSMLSQLLLWGGCAQQGSRAITAGPSIDIQTFYPFLFLEGLNSDQRFQKINDDFAYGCEENSKLIDYIQKTHVNGNQIEVVSLLQRAMRDILNEKRLPTPYFTENVEETEIRGIIPPVLVHYIYFKDSAAPETVMDDFNDMAHFCSTVDALSAVIKTNVDFEKSEHSPSILAVLHKSIFRYFVASLDPHSYILESAEQWYLDHGLINQLKRTRRENVPTVSASPGNPFYASPVRDGTLWNSEWISDSVLRIEFATFEEGTAALFEQEYKNHIKVKAPSALVIDLRRNRGGNALVVAALADLFLKEGSLLFMQERSGRIQDQNGGPFRARSGNELSGIENIPVIILVSRYSSSSSETFAAAMQDYEGAIIIGEKTQGKGTGQRGPTLSQLPLGIHSSTKLFLTTLYTYSPKGVPIQINGITPDIEVEDRDYVSRLTRYDRDSYDQHREALQWPNHFLPTPAPLETGFEPHPNEKMRQWKEKLKAHFESHRNLFTLSSLAEAF